MRSYWVPPPLFPLPQLYIFPDCKLCPDSYYFFEHDTILGRIKMRFLKKCILFIFFFPSRATPFNNYSLKKFCNFVIFEHVIIFGSPPFNRITPLMMVRIKNEWSTNRSTCFAVHDYFAVAVGSSVSAFLFPPAQPPTVLEHEQPHDVDREPE